MFTKVIKRSETLIKRLVKEKIIQISYLCLDIKATYLFITLPGITTRDSYTDKTSH
ncbi:hypothetical protein CLV62_12164 [Dysgonomonas alginatilytica]|uniref:Uncharacterized protein n=1 Tax=Dysgonomonas alginatilytica TaxID=1605892 RepID=A0A2V3PKR6_9BACT|nr:hypothetical protein CLV62_12164 [Dysgonomonas alginatilytica]